MHMSKAVQGLHFSFALHVICVCVCVCVCVCTLQDVEIKKMSGSATYGFVLFYDLLSAVSAKQYMDGENIRGNSLRVRIYYMSIQSVKTFIQV